MRIIIHSCKHFLSSTQERQAKKAARLRIVRSLALLDAMVGSVSHRPYVSERQVAEAVKKMYGIEVMSCSELPSYDDRNFRVQCHVDGHVRDFVFKVYNSNDSASPQFLEVRLPEPSGHQLSWVYYFPLREPH